MSLSDNTHHYNGERLRSPPILATPIGADGCCRRCSVSGRQDGLAPRAFHAQHLARTASSIVNKLWCSQALKEQCFRGKRRILFEQNSERPNPRRAIPASDG